MRIDGAEIEVQITEESGDTSSLSSITSSSDINDNYSVLKVIQDLKKEVDELKRHQFNESSPRNSISEENLKPLGSGTSTPPYSDSKLGALKENTPVKRKYDNLKGSYIIIIKISFSYYEFM
jgi:hypothetical protein